MEKQIEAVEVVVEKKASNGIVKKVLIGLGGIVGLAVAGVMIHKAGQASVTCPAAEPNPDYLTFSDENTQE